MTHASSSAFIFWNSVFVIVPSAWPSLYSLSLDSSKSGRGGAGGICHNATELTVNDRRWSPTKCLTAIPRCLHRVHFRNSDHAATQTPRADEQRWIHSSWSREASSVNTQFAMVLWRDETPTHNILAFVCTVNLTLSCSLSASEMSTTSVVSVDKSTSDDVWQGRGSMKSTKRIEEQGGPPSMRRPVCPDGLLRPEKW